MKTRGYFCDDAKASNDEPIPFAQAVKEIESA